MYTRGFYLLVTLLLASVLSLATAQDDAVVLKLGDKVETRSAFDDSFEIAMRGVASQQGAELDDALREQLSVYKPQFLEQRATELALVAEAERRSLSVSDEELTTEVTALEGSLKEGETLSTVVTEAGFKDEAALRAYLSERLLVQKVVAALREEAAPTDEELQAAYDARAETFTQPEQVCARHILVDSEEKAQALLDQLEEGADFAELATSESTDPGSGANGGDLGCFEQASMVEPFGEAAFAAELDTPVGPVQTQFGYHVIEVYDRKEAGQQPLKEVTPQLEQELAQEKFGTQIETLRADSGVEVFPEAAGLNPESQPDGETGGAETGGAETGGAQNGETGGAQDQETGGSAQDGETGGAADGQ
ncbi:peptidylprolyl isomerase [soil metagenome]